MTLKAVLENLDGLDSTIAGLYKQVEDGKYHLDFEPVEDDHAKNSKDKSDKGSIPRSRLNAEIEKRKSVEKEILNIAEELKTDVPEEFKSMVPDLPAGKAIAWLRDAFAKGLFDPKQSKESFDSKRPSDKILTRLDGLSPQQRIAQGYKK